MTYWLEEKRSQKNGWVDTTVYREVTGGKIQRGSDSPFAEWWVSYRHMTVGLFSAELEEGLTIAEAARQLRMAREKGKL